MPLALFAVCVICCPISQDAEPTAKEVLLEAAGNHEAMGQALKQWSGRMEVLHFTHREEPLDIYPIRGGVPPRLFESGKVLLRMAESVTFEADLARGLLFVSQKPVGPMFYVHQNDSRKVRAERPEFYSYSKSVLTPKLFSTVRWAPGSKMRPTRKDLPASAAEQESDWQFTNPIPMLGPNSWKTAELLRFCAEKRSDASATRHDDGAVVLSMPVIGALNEYELRKHDGKLLLQSTSVTMKGSSFHTEWEYQTVDGVAVLSTYESEARRNDVIDWKRSVRFTDVKVNRPLHAKFTKEDLRIDAELLR